MDFETALKEFEKAVGKLKRTYADKYHQNSSYLQIIVDDDNYVTITSTDDNGEYVNCFREWLNTDCED